MTPEQTKEHLQRRLSELGWNVHIGKSGYEKVFQVTGGTETGANQLCYKLVSLGVLQESREITDEMLDMAMTDMTRMEEIVHQSSRMADRGKESDDADLRSIEQLAALLEEKMGSGSEELDVLPPERPDYAESDAATGAKEPPAAPLPKILVVDPSREMRTAYAKVLSNDFSIVEASNGEQAWKTVLDQPDVELVVTDLIMPHLDGYDLIRRIRDAASPPHLVGMPIIVATGPEEANAKLRVLMAGANDFIVKNTDDTGLRELRARALARHKLSKTVSGITAIPPRFEKNISYGTARGSANAKRKTRSARAAAAAPPRTAQASPEVDEASLVALTADWRYADGRGREGGANKTPKRISSATAITLIATALLAVAIAGIVYVGPNAARLGIVPEVAIAPRPEAAPSVEPDKPMNATPALPAPKAPALREPGGPRAGSEQPSAPAVSPENGERSVATNTTPAPSEPKAPALRESRVPPAESKRPSTATAESTLPWKDGERSAATDTTPTPPELKVPALRESGVPNAEAERPSTPTADSSTRPKDSERLAVKENEPSVAEERERPVETKPDDTASAAAGAGTTARAGAAESVDTSRTDLGKPADREAATSARAPPETASQPPPAPPTVAPAPPAPAPVKPEETPAPPRASGERLAAVERSTPAAPRVSPRPPADSISSDELASFVRRFAAVYEAGDLEQFVGLFAENARTNDRNDRAGIRQDYASLFRTTDLRRMKLSEMNWKVDGNQAYGWGDFDVTVRRQRDRETYLYSGSLSLVVEKVGGRVRIVTLYHGQQRVGS